MQWEQIHPKANYGHLGYIPDFLNVLDPRPAKEQFAEKYISGWSPFKGHTKMEDDSLQYPGDPPMKPMWKAKLRDETIIVYQHAWVAIIQPDGSYEVARMD